MVVWKSAYSRSLVSRVKQISIVYVMNIECDLLMQYYLRAVEDCKSAWRGHN